MNVNDPYLIKVRGTRREITCSMVAEAERLKLLDRSEWSLQSDLAYAAGQRATSYQGPWGLGLGGLVGQAAAGAPIRPYGSGPCPYCGK